MRAGWEEERVGGGKEGRRGGWEKGRVGEGESSAPEPRCEPHAAVARHRRPPGPPAGPATARSTQTPTTRIRGGEGAAPCADRKSVWSLSRSGQRTRNDARTASSVCGASLNPHWPARRAASRGPVPGPSALPPPQMSSPGPAGPQRRHTLRRRPSRPTSLHGRLPSLAGGRALCVDLCRLAGAAYQPMQ